MDNNNRRKQVQQMEFDLQQENSRLREVRTGSEEIFNGTILHVQRDTVRLPNGNDAIREVIRHIGAVCVIPVLDNGDVIMERQYRYPLDRVILEIPAGKLDAANENRLSAIQRELREDTGYTAEEWTVIGDFHPAPAYSDEFITMYMARKLRKGDRHLDADEFLDVYTVPLKDLVEDVMAGRISDAKTQVCILKAARILGV